MIQLITPTPDIPCTAGWCLQYVREAFGLPARYASATEAWDNSTTQHTERDMPSGYWLPVWYAVDGVPEGHVALYAPDGSVYSTTDAGSTVPHHHPSLDDLEEHYARYGPELTWRGWTEDVAGTPVITLDGIAAQGNITQENTDMALSQQEKQDIADLCAKEVAANANLNSNGVWHNMTHRKLDALATAVGQVATEATKPGGIPSDVAASILKELSDKLAAAANLEPSLP